MCLEGFEKQGKVLKGPAHEPPGLVQDDLDPCETVHIPLRLRHIGTQPEPEREEGDLDALLGKHLDLPVSPGVQARV